MSDLYNRIMSLCDNAGISGYRLCKDAGIQPSVLTDLKMGRQLGLSAKNADKIASYFLEYQLDIYLEQSKKRAHH